MKKTVYYLDFEEKPVIIKKGYISEKLILNNTEELIAIEHKGKKYKIQNKNVYIDKLKAEERLKEYFIIKKFKATHEHKCAYCGSFIIDKEELTVDHIIPKSKGGKTEEKNLCICCKSCNQKKSNVNPFKHINRENKVQMIKEKGNRRKIGRSINLKADNVEYLAKHDSREWNLNFFLHKNPYKMAERLGC